MKNLTLHLNQLEVNNHSLQDICTALMSLSQTDIEAKHYPNIIFPLAEFMGELLDSNQDTILAIDESTKAVQHEKE